MAELPPVIKPVEVSTRLAEELKLHLLELSCTESEVSRSDLISEGLSDLTDTERDLLTGSTGYVLEVYEDTLGCLRAKINSILRILCNTLESLEHQVELSDLCEVMLAA